MSLTSGSETTASSSSSICSSHEPASPKPSHSDVTTPSGPPEIIHRPILATAAETGTRTKTNEPPYPIPSEPITHPFSPLYLSYSPYCGRSVFSSIPLGPHTLIEVSPILVLPESQVTDTVLDKYTYTFHSHNGKQQAVALGFGSLFNHDARAPNVSWSLDKQQGVIRYTTLRHVPVGQELTIYYGHDVSWMTPDQDNAQTSLREQDVDTVIDNFCKISWT